MQLNVHGIQYQLTTYVDSTTTMTTTTTTTITTTEATDPELLRGVTVPDKDKVHQ